MQTQMCGGFTGAKPVDDDAVQLCMDVKDDVQTKLGKEFSSYAPKTMITQVVAGIVYKVKIQVETSDGNNDFVHVKIFKPLPHTGNPPELQEAEAGKTSEDAL